MKHSGELWPGGTVVFSAFIHSIRIFYHHILNKNKTQRRAHLLFKQNEPKKFTISFEKFAKFKTREIRSAEHSERVKSNHGIDNTDFCDRIKSNKLWKFTNTNTKKKFPFSSTMSIILIKIKINKSLRAFYRRLQAVCAGSKAF